MSKLNSFIKEIRNKQLKLNHIQSSIVLNVVILFMNPFRRYAKKIFDDIFSDNFFIRGKREHSRMYKQPQEFRRGNSITPITKKMRLTWQDEIDPSDPNSAKGQTWPIIT